MEKIIGKDWQTITAPKDSVIEYGGKQYKVGEDLPEGVEVICSPVYQGKRTVIPTDEWNRWEYNKRHYIVEAYDGDVLVAETRCSTWEGAMAWPDENLTKRYYIKVRRDPQEYDEDDRPIGWSFYSQDTQAGRELSQLYYRYRDWETNDSWVPGFKAKRLALVSAVVTALKIKDEAQQNEALGCCLRMRDSLIKRS